MSKPIPVTDLLKPFESKKLLETDEVYIKQMMELTVELNALAEKAGVLMKSYIEAYQKITAPARLRPREAHHEQ